MDDCRQCAKPFVQCLLGTATVAMAGYASVFTWNYNRDLDAYDTRHAASISFRAVDGGCSRVLRASWVTNDCYSCSANCGTPNCYCEVNRIYNVSIIRTSTPELLTGYAYVSEVLTGSRQGGPDRSCTADVVPPPSLSTSEQVPCWYSNDPQGATSLGCGSPQCMKLLDPNNLVGTAVRSRPTELGTCALTPWCSDVPCVRCACGQPDDQRWLFVSIAAGLLLASFFVVGPCCCPGVFERLGIMTCLLQQESKMDV
jgi:hypothetical protein